MGEAKNYALAEPGGPATILNINGEVNLFGSCTNLSGTETETYGMIQEEPEEEEEGSCWVEPLPGLPYMGCGRRSRPQARQSGFKRGMLTGVNTFTACTVPKIAAYGGYTLMGTNALIGLNEANQIGTGRNVMVDTFFDGNEQAYEDFVIANSLLSMGYVEMARTNPGLGGRPAGGDGPGEGEAEGCD